MRFTMRRKKMQGSHASGRLSPLPTPSHPCQGTETSCSMPGINNMERHISPWRGIASAWAMALIVFLAFAGFQAAASLRLPAQAGQPAGVVIPQHNQRCADGQCRGVSSPFDDFVAGGPSVW
jgi:hypothetical protein